MRSGASRLRALVGLLSLGVVLAPALVTGTSDAAGQDPKFRKVSPPNVFYPLTGTRAVQDRRTYSRRHRATDIKANCNAAVWASHPGIAQVVSNRKWRGKVVVRVVSSGKGLITQYAFLTRALVSHGQIIQSGQAIGVLGANPVSRACALRFSVYGNGRAVNPSTWLNAMVGKTPPVSGMFDTRSINVASFNVLGASHTKSNPRYATYPSRLVRAASLLNARGLDVVGTQEFQEVQYDYFLNKGYGRTWGAHYWDPAGKRRDTENAIIWRKSKMEFVSGSTFDIPYFNGNIRHVPVVLLRQKSSGRTAYFLNVHNPANTRGNAAGWRAKAIQIEKNKIIELRRTGDRCSSPVTSTTGRTRSARSRPGSSASRPTASRASPAGTPGRARSTGSSRLARPASPTSCATSTRRPPGSATTRSSSAGHTCRTSVPTGP